MLGYPTTAYFRHVRLRPDRSIIQEEWIVRTISEPDSGEIQVTAGCVSGSESRRQVDGWCGSSSCPIGQPSTMPFLTATSGR